MKKLYKSLMTLTGAGLMGIALASCGTNTRNSSIPYANNVYNSDTVIATATNDITGNDMSMTLSQFYSRLRYSGYTLLTTNIRKIMYADEYTAIKELLLNPTLSANVSDKTKDLLTVKKDGTALYNLEDKTLDYTGTLTNYEFIRKDYVKTISSSLSTAIFSSSSAEAIADYEDDVLEKSYTKYIEARSREGITITKDDLAYTQPIDDSDILVFTNLIDLVQNHEKLLESYILTGAEKLATMNALYQIADEEYIYDYDDDPEEDEKTKNSNYIFEESKIEASYDATFKTYGTYQAVIIQFNSRRAAEEAMQAVSTDLGYTLTELDSTASDYETKVQAFYTALYNEAYGYDPVTDLSDSRFIYTINSEKSDLNDLNNSTISTYITETLENGDFFATPRNISDKYMMLYRVTSEYDLSANDEAKEYDDLDETEKAKYDLMVKYNILLSKYSSYTSTVYNSNIYKLMNDDDASNDLMIFDPLMEYKYYNSYSDVYSLMDKKFFNDDAIFSYNGITYSVADFYKDAANTYGTTVLTNYFQLEYAYSFAEDEDYLDSDTHDDNVDALESAIKTFNKNKNTTYPKAMGLANYLLAAYGYETKADVIKYYYDAAACLTAYKNKKVYASWAEENAEKSEEEGSKAYTITDTATTGFLSNLLATGNAKYSTLFNIDLDHILIYVDFDGDGSPDDPEEFLKKQDAATVTKFENAVAELAQAIYTEAISGNYGTNSMYTILSYIKTAYEEGQALTTDPSKTWDDYKEFQFLLKAEQLASSSDITQDSVSSFVTPFADYVKGVYKTLKATEGEDSKEYENGMFYVYTNDGTTEEGHKLTTAADASNITIDSLCSTVFGYHLLVVNDYSGPKTISYTSSDEDDIQKNLKILLIEDTDDEDNNIVVYISAENDNGTAANINQFFIYYVQSANGDTSSLTDKIKTLMATLFDDVINTYTSANFQTYLLLSKLNIKLADSTYKPSIQAENIDVSYYANQVTDYGDEEDYASWVDGTYTWDRPED